MWREALLVFLLTVSHQMRYQAANGFYTLPQTACTSLTFLRVVKLSEISKRKGKSNICPQKKQITKSWSKRVDQNSTDPSPPLVLRIFKMTASPSCHLQSLGNMIYKSLDNYLLMNDVFPWKRLCEWENWRFLSKDILLLFHLGWSTPFFSLILKSTVTPLVYKILNNSFIKRVLFLFSEENIITFLFWLMSGDFY